MLKLSMKWVAPGGFMLWAIYAHQFSDQAAAYLAQNASLVEVWAMPGLHLETYKQIVVVAQIGKPAQDPADTLKRLSAERHAGFAQLPVTAQPPRPLPQSLLPKTF